MSLWTNEYVCLRWVNLWNWKVYEWVVFSTIEDNTVPNSINIGHMVWKFKWWAHRHTHTDNMAGKCQNNSYWATTSQFFLIETVRYVLCLQVSFIFTIPLHATKDDQITRQHIPTTNDSRLRVSWRTIPTDIKGGRGKKGKFVPVHATKAYRGIVV
jgi:hypothetical protein